ncbi:MAG: protein-L-isoaspartate O-methyltransferase [Sphingomonas sp.]|nr:protein-L-isoaspartate O-methyltransferase [Sphingomonas sp.]
METAADSGRLAAMRHAMVASQLRTNSVNDPRLVAVMARVPRERFLPAEVGALAYRDTAVPLGNGRYANLPIATGRLLAMAQIAPNDHVLLIGAAGGYTAAVVAELCGSVVAVESDPLLASHARQALSDFPNVTLVEGPLGKGAADHGPYDVLVIDGAVAQLPDVLADQVKIGGRVVTGLVDNGVTRLATGCRSAGGFGLVDFADIDCVCLPGFTRTAAFVF